MKRWLSVNLQSDFEADMEEFLKVNFQKEEKVCLFIIYTATLHLKTDSLAWYNFYTHTHTHHPILIFKQIRVVEFWPSSANLYPSNAWDKLC